MQEVGFPSNGSEEQHLNNDSQIHICAYHYLKWTFSHCTYFYIIEDNRMQSARIASLLIHSLFQVFERKVSNIITF